MRRLVSFAIAACVLAAPDIARATDPDPVGTCSWSLAPHEDLPLPANAPAVFLLDRSQFEGRDALRDEIWIRSVRTAAGIDVPFAEARDAATDGYLALLGAELVSGERYELVAKHSCPGATRDADRAVKEVAHTFTAGPAVPLPTTIGTIEAGAPDRYGYVRVGIVATPELRAYLPVLAVEVLIDDALDERLPYGGLLGPELAVSTSTRAMCGLTTSGTKRVHVAVRAHVAGANADPAPAALDLDVDCTERAPYVPPRPAEVIGERVAVRDVPMCRRAPSRRRAPRRWMAAAHAGPRGLRPATHAGSFSASACSPRCAAGGPGRWIFAHPDEPEMGVVAVEMPSKGDPPWWNGVCVHVGTLSFALSTSLRLPLLAVLLLAPACAETDPTGVGEDDVTGTAVASKKELFEGEIYYARVTSWDPGFMTPASLRDIPRAPSSPSSRRRRTAERTARTPTRPRRRSSTRRRSSGSVRAATSRTARRSRATSSSSRRRTTASST
jgi:hypothetical protein